MRLEKVDGSTVIDAYGYDDKNKQLYVRFLSGGTYRYFEVPVRVWQDFKATYSKGTFFHTYIKPNYECETVNDEEASVDRLFRLETVACTSAVYFDRDGRTTPVAVIWTNGDIILSHQAEDVLRQLVMEFVASDNS